MLTQGDAMTHFLALRAAAHPRRVVHSTKIRLNQPTHIREYESSARPPLKGN